MLSCTAPLIPVSGDLERGLVLAIVVASVLALAELRRGER